MHYMRVHSVEAKLVFCRFHIVQREERWGALQRCAPAGVDRTLVCPPLANLGNVAIPFGVVMLEMLRGDGDA